MLSAILISLSLVQGFGLPIGSMVVPFCSLYLGSYKVSPKRNCYGASGLGVKGDAVKDASIPLPARRFLDTAKTQLFVHLYGFRI